MVARKGMKVVVAIIAANACVCAAAAQKSYLSLVDSMAAPRFCTPGLSVKSPSRGIDIAYNLFQGGAMHPLGPQPGEQSAHLRSLESIVVRVRAPLINRPGLKVLLGYNYVPETYRFGRLPAPMTLASGTLSAGDVFQDINTRALKHHAFNATLFKPLNERRFLGMQLRMAYNGDYSGWLPFENRYAVYSATVVYGFKPHDRLEYGFGVNFNHNFRRTRALPFIVYNRTLNPRWGVEANFPAQARVRHHLSQGSILQLGYEYHSRAYSIDVPRPWGGYAVYHLNHAEILAGLSWERRLNAWVWFNARGGYQFNFNTRFEGREAIATSFRANLANAPYLRMGFFLSPPR
jgi:hypothetical protein